MNNERYLCRGKRLDNGEWVTGYIFCTENSVYIKRVDELLMEVKRKTVGQCTGLHDKNGTPIFEGDIVKDHSGLYSLAQVIWHTKNLAWGVLTLGERNYPLCRETNCEIVGNIHENSDLLKGGDGE